MKSKPHYSGEKSRLFWKEVAKLRGGNYQELYSLGVALQNLEEYVLKALANAKSKG